jgi:hypothetical protein
MIAIDSEALQHSLLELDGWKNTGVRDRIPSDLAISTIRAF